MFAKAKLTRKKEDRNDWLPGATGNKLANTDQVPTWVKDVCNFYWGFQSENQRHVVTGGREITASLHSFQS